MIVENLQGQKVDQVFIRLATKKEIDSPITKRRAMNSFEELEGYEIVYKPWGEQGKGFYYSQLV